MNKRTKSSPRRPKPRSASAILTRLVGRSSAMNKLIEEERLKLGVAAQVYAARASRKLTQAQLAKLVGTTQSVIARLEDADYDGHSLTMLRRIADALGYKLEVRFVELVKAA